MTPRARIAVLVTVVVLAGLGCQAALGFWTGAGRAGGGGGAALATTVSTGAAPTASETGAASVVVSWGGSGLSNGAAADGYLVKRYDRETGIQAAIGAGCSMAPSPEPAASACLW